jgi:hypothetical protein
MEEKGKTECVNIFLYSSFSSLPLSLKLFYILTAKVIAISYTFPIY